MYPFMTAELAEQRRRALETESRRSSRRPRWRRAPWPRRLQGWLDRVVPAEAGPARLRARGAP